jgi:hypothetical protein
LAYNTTYAILLGNHVPTVPLRYHPSDYDFLVEGIGEDKLFLFKTEKESDAKERERKEKAIHCQISRHQQTNNTINSHGSLQSNTSVGSLHSQHSQHSSHRDHGRAATGGLEGIVATPQSSARSSSRPTTPSATGRGRSTPSPPVTARSTSRNGVTSPSFGTVPPVAGQSLPFSPRTFNLNK